MTGMRIVSAEQFVRGILVAMSLEGVTTVPLDDPGLYERFSKAYDDLLDAAEIMGLVPDFVISADPYHGDSLLLRDTILGVEHMRDIAFHDPRLDRVTITVPADVAEKTMADGPVPADVLRRLVRTHMVDAREFPLSAALRLRDGDYGQEA